MAEEVIRCRMCDHTYTVPEGTRDEVTEFFCSDSCFILWLREAPE